jgi:hypothetical protein
MKRLATGKISTQVLTFILLNRFLVDKSCAEYVGHATIWNLCYFPVFIWSTANETNTTANELLPGSCYIEDYRLNPNGGGISLKIATVPTDAIITQFEYTYTVNSSRVYYDISNINGYPFKDWGFILTPSIPSCTTVFCDPGIQFCADIYNAPNDTTTKSCYTTADLSLNLCSSKSS